MSGHNKFSNIKHKKEKNDAAKGKIYTKLGREIAVAVKEGGADPNNNSRLKDIITKAKAQNMPNDNIDRAIKKGSGELGNAIYESITYEGYGIGGIAVIVETLSDNRNRTGGDVRYIFDKNGGNLGTNGCVSYMFDQKGQIVYEDDGTIDEDTLMEDALDAGADDFVSEDGTFVVTTAPADFLSVSEALDAKGYKPISAEVAMVPQNYTELTDPDQLKKFYRMLDMFDDNDDVQDVYHNAILPEEDEE